MLTGYLWLHHSTVSVCVSDSRKRRSGLPGLSSSQRAPHSAEASGFPHGGQRKEGVPLKLSAELNQQELQPASLWLVFILCGEAEMPTERWKKRMSGEVWGGLIARECGK